MEENLNIEELKERFLGEAISAEKEINEKVNKAIKSNEASRRWFWELMQNAIDTTAEGSKVNVKLIIENTDSGTIIKFQHDGGPFRKAQQKYRFDDFKNLINPTSGKSQEDTGTIGKFGTGFLSTHIVSLKIGVQGVFEDSLNEKFLMHTILDRKDFLLETDEARNKRIESIIQSLIEYEKSKREKLPYDQAIPVAEFTYYPNESTLKDNERIKKIVDDGIKEIYQSLPFVFLFTDKIGRVIIHDRMIDKKISYSNNTKDIEKGILRIRNTEIKENDIPRDPISLAYLQGEKCTIAWKVNPMHDANSKLTFLDCRGAYKTELNNEMASLFSTFPLIGSHDFKFPIVVHSNLFKPNETRDGISLKDSDTNKLIIDSAVELYKQFLNYSSLDANNLYHICDIVKTIKPDHPWIDVKWFNEYQTKLKNIILSTKIIDTSDLLEKRKSIINDQNLPQLFFPDLKINKEVADDVRNRIIADFYTFSERLYFGLIPTKESLVAWKKCLWDEKEKIRRINENDLIDRISDSTSLEDFENYFKNDFADKTLRTKESVDWLSELYKFIINDLENIDLLNYSSKLPKRGIILSRSRKFKLFHELKKDIGFEKQIINEELLSISSEWKINTFEYRDKLLNSNIQVLSSLKNETITEESIAEELKKETDNLIKKHDEILKLIGSGNCQPSDQIQRKEIERKLSNLQNWIAKFNSERKYFDNYLKRKILQVIIDEKKSESLTELLELDRSGKRTLEEQTEILKDPDLDEKLKLGDSYLRKKREKEERDQLNRKIGEHFENLFKLILAEEKIISDKQDGAQDFIINPNTDNVFFVELKSISDSKDSVLLTPEQALKLQNNKENYFICIIPHSGDVFSFTKDDFKRNAIFNNSLYNFLNDKPQNIRDFQEELDGIKGVFPEDILMNFFEKPYKYRVQKSIWGDLQFDYFLKSIYHQI
jgi:hypothetical protein